MKGLRPQESFVYPVIDDRPLWPKRVPSGEQCDGEHGEGKFPFVYVDVSFEIRAAASPPKKAGRWRRMTRGFESHLLLGSTRITKPSGER
jgi:hypothetical protein